MNGGGDEERRPTFLIEFYLRGQLLPTVFEGSSWDKGGEQCSRKTFVVLSGACDVGCVLAN